MGVMRGVLDGAVEVAVVVAVRPDGIVRPVALLATPGIAEEVEIGDGPSDGIRRGRIGDDPIDVLVAPAEPNTVRPLAVLTTPWIAEHLALYARRLWRSR